MSLTLLSVLLIAGILCGVVVLALLAVMRAAAEGDHDLERLAGLVVHDAPLMPEVTPRERPAADRSPIDLDIARTGRFARRQRIRSTSDAQDRPYVS